MAAVVVAAAGVTVASGLAFGAYKVMEFTIGVVKSHMTKPGKNSVIVYIVAYDAFHTAINVYDGEVYYEFEWNKNEKHPELFAALIMRRYRTESGMLPVAWLAHAVTELHGVTADEFADVIKEGIYREELFVFPGYLVTSCNCRTFCDMVIDIVEEYVVKHDTSGGGETVHLSRCTDFGLVIGSGNIADSLTTLHTKLLLLGKLAGGVQQARIESYQETVEVIRQFEFSMSN
jgi:hypothetical protein